MRLRRRRTTRLGEACMEPLFLEKPVRSVNFEQAFFKSQPFQPQKTLAYEKILTRSREAHGEGKICQRTKRSDVISINSFILCALCVLCG